MSLVSPHLEITLGDLNTDVRVSSLVMLMKLFWGITQSSDLSFPGDSNAQLRLTTIT